MNDIYHVSKKFHSLLYADDTTLESPLCTFDTSASNNKYSSETLSLNINIELKLILDWLSLNKLSLNVKKTKFMIFHHRQRNIGHFIPQLRINNNIIERVNEFDFLGITLDEHMNWHCHIHKITNKISRTLGILCKLKKLLPQIILKLIYNSLVLPHLNYGILRWSFRQGTIIK